MALSFPDEDSKRASADATRVSPSPSAATSESGDGGSGRTGSRATGAPGKAVQVEPIKPTLKPPGTKRLKLEYVVPLSNVAFKFNLHRYTPGPAVLPAQPGGPRGPRRATLGGTRRWGSSWRRRRRRRRTPRRQGLPDIACRVIIALVTPHCLSYTAPHDGRRLPSSPLPSPPLPSPPLATSSTCALNPLLLR